MAIGISDKISYSYNDGYFSSNTLLLEEIKSNIKNWLQTNPGERIMMPSWGLGPNSFIFSPSPDNTADQIQAKIRDGFSSWFPFIKINSIESKTSKNTITLTLNLTFRGKEFTLEQVLTSVM
jgi:phage baseplate assembly protein W